MFEGRAHAGIISQGQDGCAPRWQITAAQAYLAYEAGAYPGAGGPGGMCVFAAYDLANVTIDGFDGGEQAEHRGYRAPGATNAAFATGA